MAKSKKKTNSEKKPAAKPKVAKPKIPTVDPVLFEAEGLLQEFNRVWFNILGLELVQNGEHWDILDYRDSEEMPVVELKDKRDYIEKVKNVQDMVRVGGAKRRKKLGYRIQTIK